MRNFWPGRLMAWPPRATGADRRQPPVFSERGLQGRARRDHPIRRRRRREGGARPRRRNSAGARRVDVPGCSRLISPSAPRPVLKLLGSSSGPKPTRRRGPV